MRRSLASLLAATVAALPLTSLAQTPTPAPEQPAQTQGTPTPAPQEPTERTPTPAAVPAPPPAPGKVTFTPYGFILTNVFFNSRAFANDDYPQYAVNGPGIAGASALNDRGILFSSRYNRIGVKIGGAEAMGAKLGAVIEADFGFGFVVSAGQGVQASTQASNFDWYKPIARMRLGYATATWGDPDAKLTLLMGQDYGLVNPLFAVTLGYIGTPLFQNAGNLYTRSPMVKLTGEMGKDTGITFAVAAMDPMDQNIFAGAGSNQETPTLSSGNRARIPELEARVSGKFKSELASGEVGVSGGYHKERYLLGAATTTTSSGFQTFTPNGQYVDLDSAVGGVDAVFKFPFIEVRGEGFMGHNADMYFAHLGQGGTATVSVPVPPTVPPGATSVSNVTGVVNKRTKGFWVQGILSPIPEIQLTGGYGVETPFESDIAVGARSRNSIASAGIIWSASKALKFSAEGAYTYTGTKTAKADTSINGYQTVLSSQYTF
jgi:hypothetical protein